MFFQDVLSCSTHPSRGPLQSSSQHTPPSKCPLPASVAPAKQLLLQRVSPRPQRVHNSHGKASEPVAVGASPTFPQAHSNHMQTSQPANLRTSPAKQHACSSHSQPQQEDTHSPHWGNTWSPGSETMGLCHRAPRDNIYMRLLFKGWETYLTCLIHRNKHKELSKMRRQTIPSKQKKQDESFRKRTKQNGSIKFTR